MVVFGEVPSLTRAALISLPIYEEKIQEKHAHEVVFNEDELYLVGGFEMRWRVSLATQRISGGDRLRMKNDKILSTIITLLRNVDKS